MPPKYVSTFRAPTEYERQLEEARRRAMLAEALAQQQYEPMEGTAAPIPKAAPLVKALQGYLTAREGRKAREAEETAKGMEADYAQRMLGRMEGGYVYDPTAPAPAPIPEQTQLEEITRQSRYKKSPEEALAMASTSLGTAALKDRPIMAARLAKMLETPEGEEFYAPTETAEGFVQFGKRGGRKDTGVAAPTKAPEPTTTQRDYEFARSQGYKGTFEQFRESNRPQTNVYSTTAVAGVDANGNPVFFQTSPTGGAPMVVPGVRPKPEAPGVEESKSALFADRMAESAPLLDILPPPSITASAKGKTPLVGNVLLSPENKQFNQAALNFISAVLRKESGANIPDTEIESQAKIYIPMAGDDPTTREQKRRARESAIRGLALSAGPSYKPVPINPPEGVTPQEWAVMTLDERRKFAR